MTKKKINYDLVKEVTKGAHLSEQSHTKRSSEQIVEIPLESLEQNPYQPRINIDREYIEDLANSIKENGLVQPITVVQNGEKYTIVYGHRRVAAHVKLEEQTIKAIVRDDIKKDSMAILPIVENIQREDMNPIETAISLKRIITDRIINSQSELSKTLGVNRSWVSKMLSILKLPESVIEKIRVDGYKDVEVLTYLNRLSENHMDVYNTIRSLDRKSAIAYIKKTVGEKTIHSLKRVETKGNKIVINTKGLASSKKEEIKRYLNKIEELLSLN